MISYIDNFLTEKEFEYVSNYCFNSSYTYGEQDRESTPPTGMISYIEDNDISELFEDKINKSIDAVKDLRAYRMYINCFAPGENPYFHTDGKTGITCLFYANPEFKINDGGETQFFIDEHNFHSILPIPNRLCYFDASILHRATSFRNTHRFTIALKYK